MAEKANVILAVDESNRVALLQLFPDLKSKIFKLSELTGRDEDFTDPETIRGIEKHFKILSGIKDTIIQGFPKLISLAMKEKKN
jgi:protein-tyrosine-phosphatase